MLFRFIIAVVLSARCLNAQNIVNGQIFTPGIAIVDSPQPNTPLGGGESFCRVIPDGTVLMADRSPASRDRCELRWATAITALSFESKFCDLEYYHFPLQLYHGLELHHLEWNGDEWECG
jgi:hypothetical protein